MPVLMGISKALYLILAIISCFVSGLKYQKIYFINLTVSVASWKLGHGVFVFVFLIIIVITVVLT